LFRLFLSFFFFFSFFSFFFSFFFVVVGLHCAFPYIFVPPLCCS